MLLREELEASFRAGIKGNGDGLLSKFRFRHVALLSEIPVPHARFSILIGTSHLPRCPEGIRQGAFRWKYLGSSDLGSAMQVPPPRLKSWPLPLRDCADLDLPVDFAFQGNGFHSLPNHVGQYARTALVGRRHSIVTHGFSPARICPGRLIRPGIFREGKHANDLPARRIRVHKAGRHLGAAAFRIGPDD